jgi:AbiV family abortive infection protein
MSERKTFPDEYADHPGRFQCDMSTDLKPEWSPDEPVVKGALEHTAGLIEGAKTLFNRKLPHLAYHLALLALEEIGKLEVVLMGRVGTKEEDAAYQKKLLDDHVGKIFWAFWGPTFTHNLIDPQQVQWHMDLATKLHEKRLRGLYVDPGAEEFVSPAAHVSPGDAVNLIELAESRLGIQREHQPGDLTEEEKADLVWFRAARYDAQKKQFVLGRTSREKLAELQDVRLWMKWLHGTIEAQEAELVALAEAEMKRQVQEGDIDRPKWKVRIRVRTNSHIIKPKSVNAWNAHGTPFKWVYIQKPDEFYIEFTLPKSVKAEELYEAGLSMCYRYLAALNIGTQGFFWFDLPLQTEKFHEQIEDLESKNLIEVGRKAVKRVNRKVEPVSDTHLHWVLIAFALLPFGGRELFPFEMYGRGLVSMAKTDIHSGFEIEAFRHFFDSFTSAMHLYGDWDGKMNTVRDAAAKVLAPSIIGSIEDTVKEVFDLADTYHSGTLPDVNIEQAAVMKLLTDVYLCGVLDREGQRRARAEAEARAALLTTTAPTG